MPRSKATAHFLSRLIRQIAPLLFASNHHEGIRFQPNPDCSVKKRLFMGRCPSLRGFHCAQFLLRFDSCRKKWKLLEVQVEEYFLHWFVCALATRSFLNMESGPGSFRGHGPVLFLTPLCQGQIQRGFAVRAQRPQGLRMSDRHELVYMGRGCDFRRGLEWPVVSTVRGGGRRVSMCGGVFTSVVVRRAGLICARTCPFRILDCLHAIRNSSINVYVTFRLITCSHMRTRGGKKKPFPYWLLHG